MILLTELVLLTSVLSVTLISRQHNTECSGTVAQGIFYTRAEHIVEVTHTLLVTSISYWMSQSNALTQATLYQYVTTRYPIYISIYFFVTS